MNMGIVFWVETRIIRMEMLDSEQRFIDLQRPFLPDMASATKPSHKIAPQSKTATGSTPCRDKKFRLVLNLSTNSI